MMQSKRAVSFAVNIHANISVNSLLTAVLHISEVIGIRVPKRLKEELQELNLDYAEEVRACLEKMVKRKKLEQVLAEVDRHREEFSKKHGLKPSSAHIFRRDRDSDHSE